MCRGIFVAAFVAALFFGGCGLISGVDDFQIVDSLPDADVSRNDGGTLDAPDGRVSPDAPSNEGGVVPMVVPCGEARVCVPNTNGWTPAVFAGAGALCPATWPRSTEVQSAGGGGCACECTASGGTCEGPLDVNKGAACTTVAGAFNNVPGNGSCTTVTVSGAIPAAMSLKPRPSIPPSACTGSVQATFSAPPKVLTCSGAEATPSDACGAGEACVPTFQTPAGAANCIEHEGEVACPQSLPVRVVVGASVEDGRSCGSSCSCGLNGCIGGTLEIYDVTGCPQSNLKRSQATDGSCDADDPAFAEAKSMRYFATSGCTVTQQPTVVGTQTFTSPRTFCCLDGAK